MMAERSESEERKLGVLHVVSYFPPDRIGGLGEVVAHLHEALLRAGHDSHVLTSGRTTGDPRIVRLPGGPTRFTLTCWRHLSRAKRADVVHVHHGEALLLLLLMRLLRVRVPIVLTLHVSLPHLMRSLRPFEVNGHRLGQVTGGFARAVRTRVRTFFDRWAMALADEVSFISRSVAADVLPLGRAESARVIYNGLPARPTPNAVADPVEVLFVGTPSIRKRIQILPFVLAKIREKREGCRMRVIGFVPEDDVEFLRWARALEVLDAFVFEGRMRSEEIAAYYAAAQVLLVPSAYEGLPMVVLEAYQLGLPCVATRVSGHPEVVEDGYNGFLVEVDRPDGMAQAVLSILEDPAKGRRMGARGKALIAERFGVERQLRAYVELYRGARSPLGGRARGFSP
jgi:glycosyltransferase involved in cell wall biosynthesis